MTAHLPVLVHESKPIPLAHKYMSAHLLVLVHESKPISLTHKCKTAHMVHESKPIPLTHKYMTAHLPYLVHEPKIQSGGVKLVLWAQTYHLNGIMLSCIYLYNVTQYFLFLSILRKG